MRAYSLSFTSCRLLIGASVLLAITPAWAQLFPDNDARKAILELREKSVADQKLTNERLDRLDERAARAQLDLAQQLEAIRRDVAAMRGMVEVLQKDVADLQKRQRDVYADIDSRLKKQEPERVAIDGREVVAEQDQTRSYNAALEQYRASQWAAAASSFATFLRSYPQSPYAPLAQFWLGNAQFATRDFKTAIATHQAFIKANPDNPRVSDALINIGSSQLELGNKAGAKAAWKEVVDKYPSTPAAQSAKERLAAVK